MKKFVRLNRSRECGNEKVVIDFRPVRGPVRVRKSKSRKIFRNSLQQQNIAEFEKYCFDQSEWTGDDVADYFLRVTRAQNFIEPDIKHHRHESSWNFKLMIFVVDG